MNQLVFQHFYICLCWTCPFTKIKKNRWRQKRIIKPIFRHINHSTSGQCCSFLMIGFVGSRHSHHPAGSSAASEPLVSRNLPVHTAKKNQNQPPVQNSKPRDTHLLPATRIRLLWRLLVVACGAVRPVLGSVWLSAVTLLLLARVGRVRTVATVLVLVVIAWLAAAVASASAAVAAIAVATRRVVVGTTTGPVVAAVAVLQCKTIC